MKNRRAFTLIEMSVCISLGSILLTLAIGLVHRSMHNESSNRRTANVERTATRLSDQFRRDVHQAKNASLDGLDTKELVLVLELMGEPNVTYRLEEHTIIREKQLDNRQTQREQFDFPDDHELEVGELNDPPRIVLTFRQDTGLAGISPSWKLHVEAVVGRFNKPVSTQEVAQ